MTVGDLIKELAEYPSSMEVVGVSSENQHPHEDISLDAGYYRGDIDQWVDVDDGIKFVGADEYVRVWFDT